MWTEIETDHDLSYRAILEDYIVFLRLEPSDLSRRKQKKSRSAGDQSRSTGANWYIHFLIPDDERSQAYLAGEGFSSGTSLARAQNLALEKAQELRGALSRQQQRKLRT
jgi:hypothetical protein